MANPIPGVYLDESRTWNFENSGAAIAGYLGLQDTAALRDFIGDEGIKSVLEAYLTERQGFFGSVDPNATEKERKSAELKKINPRVLHSAAQDPSYMRFMLQTTNVVLTPPVVGRDSIAVVSTLNFITRLVRAAPRTFSSSTLPPAGQFRLDPEDVHRGFYLLKHVWKRNQESRKGKGRFQNKPAVQIVYRNRSADVMGSLILAAAETGASQQQSGGTGLSDSGMPTQEQPNYAPYKDVAGNPDDDKAADDPKNDRLFDPDMPDTVAQLAADLSKIFEKRDNQKSARPPLSRREQVKILEHIGGKVDVTSEHFVEVRGEALKTTQNIIGQQEAMELAEAEIQVKMPSASVSVPTQTEAGKILGIDPRRPLLFEGSEHETRLNPWQTSGAVKMVKTEGQPLGGGILGDDCGLGKTLTALTLVYMSPKVRAGPKKFRPTLVACPASVINVWVTEYIKRFSTGLRLYIVHGSKAQTSDPRRKDLTVDPSAFADLLDSFDETDILTARTVILTAYGTWAKRSLEVIPTPNKKTVTEAATDGHSEQASSKAIDSGNSVNDSGESGDEAPSGDGGTINNNEGK